MLVSASGALSTSYISGGCAGWTPACEYIKESLLNTVVVVASGSCERLGYEQTATASSICWTGGANMATVVSITFNKVNGISDRSRVTVVNLSVLG